MDAISCVLGVSKPLEIKLEQEKQKSHLPISPLNSPYLLDPSARLVSAGGSLSSAEAGLEDAAGAPCDLLLWGRASSGPPSLGRFLLVSVGGIVAIQKPARGIQRARGYGSDGWDLAKRKQ